MKLHDELIIHILCESKYRNATANLSRARPNILPQNLGKAQLLGALQAVAALKYLVFTAAAAQAKCSFLGGA